MPNTIPGTQSERRGRCRAGEAVLGGRSLTGRFAVSYCFGFWPGAADFSPLGLAASLVSSSDRSAYLLADGLAVRFRKFGVLLRQRHAARAKRAARGRYPLESSV